MLWGVLVAVLLSGVAKADNCNAMRELLCGFYSATGGANWSYARAACDPSSTPNSTRYCWCQPGAPEACSWWQVECTGTTCADSAVANLELPANTGLVGSLPPTLGYALAALAPAGQPGFQVLSLQEERGLTGDLVALKGLSTLTTLRLTGTRVTAALGALDHVLRDNPGLASLDLTGGQFGGPLPPALTAMRSLASVQLTNNAFTGNLSTFDFSGATALQHIDFSGNQLVGGIPPLPPGIRDFIVSDNFLTGSLPAEFTKLFNLTVLSLAENNFTGKLTNLRMCHNSSDDATCLTTDPRNPAGTTVLSSLVLRNNAFEGDLDEVFDRVVFQDNGAAMQMRFPLYELDLSSNRFSGRLSRRLSLAGKLGLRRLVLTHNPGLDQDQPFPPFLAPEFSTLVVFPGQFLCPVFRDVASLLVVVADPQVLQFMNCSCERGFFGSPRVQCTTCLEGALCDGGATVKLRPGLFPLSVPRKGGWFELAGLEHCDPPEACNPNGSYVYPWNASSVVTHDFCGDGYENRLCSQCRDGFYGTSLGCEQCGTQLGLLYYGLLSVVFFANMLLAVLSPCVTVRTGSRSFAKAVFAVQVLTLCAGVAMSAVPGLGSWYSDAILLLLLVLLEDTWDEVELDTGDAHSSAATLQGCTKESTLDRHSRLTRSLLQIMLFFLQATVILNVRFWTEGGWPAARWVVFSLQFINLDLRGLLACTAVLPQFREQTWPSVLLTLVTPIGLFAVCLVVAAFAKTLEDAALAAEARKQRRLERRVPHRLVLLEASSEEQGEAGGGGGLALQAEEEEADEKEDAHARLSFRDRVASVGLRIASAAYMELCVGVFANLGCSADPIDGSFFSRLFSFVPCGPQQQAVEWALSGPFLVYVIGIPILFGLLLRFRRHEPYMHCVTVSYREGGEAHELLFFARRLLLALAVGVVPDSMSSLVVVTVLLAAISAQFLLHSFRSNIVNWLDVLAMCVVAVTHSQIAVVSAASGALAPLVVVSALNVGVFVALSLVLLSASWRSLRAQPEPDDELDAH